MRKVILFMHTSLDGFVAGKNGEINWVSLDDGMFDFVGTFTDNADTALYGRVTWQMMEAYWPTAGDKPNASRHDKEHSRWYKQVEKVVLSRSMKGKKADKTRFISDNLQAEISALKNKPGKNIMIFGSPSAAQSLMKLRLIDEYWLFVNPLILGDGIPLFPRLDAPILLKHAQTKEFECGVTGLNYVIK